MTHDLVGSLALLPTFEEQCEQWCSERPAPELGAERPTLGSLSRRLAAAEIMDIKSIDTPGAVVVLPWGVQLTRRLRAGVEKHYEARGYEAYSFPHVAPESIYRPAISAFGDVQRFLYVADRERLAAGEARGVLAPTGEAMIYHHWERTLRTSGDLPQRLYREATYFRPTPTARGRAGRGVFRPLEAPDVYEFHCAVADELAVLSELNSALAMVNDVLRDWRTPVLWSVRPPWGNHGELYRAAFGADTLLPSGEALQVGVVYDQGRVFSRAFNIRIRSTRPEVYPLHVAGCVTRRVVLAHIFGSDVEGGFSLHPHASPIQVQVRGSAAILPLLAAKLADRGVRHRLASGTPRELTAAHRRAVARGIPAHVLVQGPRYSGDLARIVLGDAWGAEQELRLPWPEGLDTVATAVGELLEQVAARHDDVTRARWAGVRQVPLTQAEGVVRAGGVAVVPLDVSAEALVRAEAIVPGEALGFVRSSDPVRCSVTGKTVNTYALVARRT